MEVSQGDGKAAPASGAKRESAGFRDRKSQGHTLLCSMPAHGVSGKRMSPPQTSFLYLLQEQAVSPRKEASLHFFFLFQIEKLAWGQ